MDLLSKMTCFNIPSNIPRDAANSSFSLSPKLLQMVRHAQETGYAGVKRNNLFTVYPASLPTKVIQISHLSVGWMEYCQRMKKLKEEIPSHEHSTLHKENYAAWNLLITFC